MAVEQAVANLSTSYNPIVMSDSLEDAACDLLSRSPLLGVPACRFMLILRLCHDVGRQPLLHKSRQREFVLTRRKIMSKKKPNLLLIEHGCADEPCIACALAVI